MATRVQKVKVGVFLIVSAGLITVALAVISGFYRPAGITYWIEFDESVLGLYEGGTVEYLGVPVGKVRQIYVTPENRAHVVINIDPETVTLNKGVEAQLVIYSLAAGTMALSLTGGDPDKGPLPPGSEIPAKPSTITAVSGHVEVLMEDLTTIADAVRNGLEGLEEGQLSKMVNDVGRLIEDGRDMLRRGSELVDEAKATLGDVGGNAERVVDDISDVVADVRRVSEDLSRLANTATGKLEELDVPKMQQELQRTLENVAEVSEELKTIVDEFDDTAASVLHEADNVEHSLRQALGEMAETLETTRRFLDLLQRNPTAILRGKGTEKEPRR